MIQSYKRGDTVASLYEIRDVFVGGMGEVYLAYHRERKKFYVLKTIQEKYFRSRDDFLTFRREAEVWITLGNSSSIVQAISIRDFEGRLFLVLEYIEPDSKGRNTLSDYLVGNPLPYKQILLNALQFCDGMNYAKERGLQCHRDIKPNNIMITKNGVVKITDFGLAKTIHFSESSHPTTENVGIEAFGGYEITTVLSDAKGTPPYMAPEVFTGYKNADEISDVYSFGIVLFQMLTGGERPFNPGVDSPDVYRYLHQNATIPELESPLFPIVEKCLAKERRDRYQSFSELQRELESYYKRLIGKTPPSPMEVVLTAEDIRHFSQALFELKYFEKAFENCDRALAMNKRDHETWNLRGMIYHALKKNNEALNAFEKAMEIKPDYYAPWNNKGMILQENGQTENALSCFKRVISLRPDYREAWNNIGTCLQVQGKIDEAIGYYCKAVELDPRYRDAYLNMGDCFIRLRQYKEALNCYERAKEVDPYDTYILKNLEKLYQVLGFRTGKIDS